MSIRPFAEQGHYTAIHDSIFDVVMPKCPPNAWKVLCFIIRKTRGWSKDEDSIPYSQILEGTGINSKATVSSALKWLAEKKLIVRDAGRDKKGKQKVSSYRLNRDYELDSGSEIEPQPSTETEHGSGAEIEPGPSTEIEPLKNHTVSQEPENKKQVSPEGADAAGQTAENQKSNQKQKSKNDHTGKLIDDLEELGFYLDRDEIVKLSGNFGALKKKGVSHEEMVRVRMHMVAEWPRYPMTPQKALTDIRREGRGSVPNNVTQIRSRKVDEEPETEAERRHRREDAERLERLRQENGIAQ